MKTAHFFDIDCILVTDNKVWIIDKNSPNVPILKIRKSDFNLIKNGIYRNQNNNVYFGGVEYWLPNDIIESLKIRCKQFKCDISNLAFSLQEYMNKDVIDTIDYNINLDNILHLKNTNDDIYFLCSKNTEKNYGSMLKKIENKLKDEGLVIKKYYYLSETFYNRDHDDISHKKSRLLLQHIIGLKTDGDKFTNEQLENYDEIYFYDNDFSAIQLVINSNELLRSLISNSDADVKNLIKDELKNGINTIYVNSVSDNKLNRFGVTKVELEYQNLIRTFESFKYSNNFPKLK